MMKVHQKQHSCAVMFYFNYTCCVKKNQPKISWNKDHHYYLHIHSTTLHPIYTLKYSGDNLYSWHGITMLQCILKSEVHDKIWVICTYTELGLKCEGFNSNCNRDSTSYRNVQGSRAVYVGCVSVMSVCVLSSKKESPKHWFDDRQKVFTYNHHL